MSKAEIKGRAIDLVRRVLPLPLRRILWSLREGVPLGSILLQAFHELRVWGHRLMPDRYVQASQYRRAFGRPLRLSRPKRFTEKLHWLMLHYRNPEMTRLADKYGVRPFVAARAGGHLLNDLYGLWNDPADIAFDLLPKSFVLKVTSCCVMSVMTAVPVSVLPEAVPENVPVICPSRTFPDTAL